jgi:23S rRNA (uridine2552-2'-O)-methyltransferase
VIPQKHQIIKTWFHRKKKIQRWAFVVRDEYAIKAQKEWYRARSIYKFFEIQERFNIIKSDSKVIDIWSAPGSFLQALWKIVKNEIIVWVDIQEIKPLWNGNIKTIVNDIFDYEWLSKKVTNLVWDDQFDVITSDIAPNTTWVFDVDQYASVELNIAICEFSDRFLRKWWDMILKVFKWADFNELVQEVKKRFNEMKTYKPRASRDSSHEEYVICIRKK